MADLERRKGFYGDRERESPVMRAERQWVLLEKLIRRAYEGSAEFKSRLAGIGAKPGDIRSIEDFRRLPVLPKKDLLARQCSGPGLGGMLTTEPGRLGRIYQSPGPIYDPEGRGPDYWGWAEAFFAAGFRQGDVVQNTFSYHLTPAGLMLEEPLRAIGCAVIPAGPGNTEKQIELMTDLPVTGFVGMASYLRVIADKAAEKGLDLWKDFSLECAFVAAERLSESMRSELESDFGMLIRQGYGTADVGCIAYECLELGGMHLTSRGLVEILDPVSREPMSAGEIGEVVFTPFSEEYPLIRFATGDLSFVVDSECPCGRTSPKLGGIQGRVDDTAKVKGQFIYPSQAAEVLERFPAVTAWRLVVDNPGGRDRLRLLVDAREGLDEKALVRGFQEACKLRPLVERVEGLEEGPRLRDEREFD